MNSQPSVSAPEIELLVGLIEHIGGADARIPFGTIAHLARLYVICDQQMKDQRWEAAYRTIVSLYRIERDLSRERPVARAAPAPRPPAPSRPAPPPTPKTPGAPSAGRFTRPMTEQELQDTLVALTGVTPLPREALKSSAALTTPAGPRPDG